MKSEEIDRLFREKADRFKVEPSENAWLSIESQIGKSRKGIPIYWYVAASVTALVLIAIALVKNPGYTDGQQMVAITHPVPMDTERFEIRLDLENSTDELASLEEQSTLERRIPAEIEIKQSVLEISSKPGMLALENSTLDFPDLFEAPNMKPTQPSRPSVRITYYTGSAQKKQEKKGIKQFIAKAQDFRPGEIMADLRSAKDEIFNSNRRTNNSN